MLTPSSTLAVNWCLQKQNCPFAFFGLWCGKCSVSNNNNNNNNNNNTLTFEAIRVPWRKSTNARSQEPELIKLNLQQLQKLLLNFVFWILLLIGLETQTGIRFTCTEGCFRLRIQGIKVFRVAGNQALTRVKKVNSRVEREIWNSRFSRFLGWLQICILSDLFCFGLDAFYLFF